MPDMNTKLARFTAAILAEATAESERSMEQVKQQRSQACRAAEDQILLETYQYIRREVAAIKADAGRSVSRHMMDNKRTLSLRREAISREVFALVEEKIDAYTRTPAYAARLAELLRQALAQLDGTADDLEVSLRPQDKGHIPALTAAAGRPVRFAEGEFRLGGLVVQSAKLGLRVDQCFDSAMDALSGHFAELFGLSLADDDDK
jgi:vacuolar-type H+-ATPase subunit E/Vma4